MAEEQLDGAQVGACFEQVNGEGMTCVSSNLT
jgi:hypothetical protein